MTEPLKLTAAIRTHGQTADFKSGAVPIPGVAIEYIEVKPQIAAFRRMVRNLDFDICELASTTYMCARAHDVQFKALPIFFGRRFHHRGLVVRPDSGITVPKDLEGKKVGVRAYSVTTGVWTRGILQNEYGVDLAKVTWVVDDEEHVQQLTLPENVEHVPEGKSLASMMAAGEIQAGFLANAGIGREGPPREDWAAKPVPATEAYRELIPDAAEREAEWYARTGILPSHGLIVLRNDVVAANPDLPRRIFDALVESKQRYLARLNAGESIDKNDQKMRNLMKIVGPDPLPYGIKANLPTIEALAKYAVQQKLMPAPLAVEELFFDLEP